MQWNTREHKNTYASKHSEVNPEVVIALALDGSEIGARVLGVVIPHLCFADISLLADNEHELQHLLNRIHETTLCPEKK